MSQNSVFSYILPILKLYPWVIPVIVTLGIISSFFEGFGISLFIPLLQSLEQADLQQNNNNFLVNFLNPIFVGVAPNRNAHNLNPGKFLCLTPLKK